MAGTRRRTTVNHSSTSQAPRSTIQILRSRTVQILEPMNHEGDDIDLGTATHSCYATVLNATMLPAPPPHSEDVPHPPTSPEVPSPLEANEVLMNLVNFLCPQNDKLEHVEKNQEKILTVIATQIEEARRSEHRTMPLEVDDATSVLVNRQSECMKPPGDSDRGSNSPPLHRPERHKPLKYHKGKGSPPRHSRPKEGDYSP